MLTFRTLSTFVLATLALGSTQVGAVSAAALPRFNTSPDSNGLEREFLTGRNITAGQTVFVDPVAGSANDTFEVAVFYHAHKDVFPAAVTNVRAKVALSAATATSHTIRAELSGDNAQTTTSSYLGTTEVGTPDLTITTSAPSTLALVPGSVKLLQRKSDSDDLFQISIPDSNPDALVSTGIKIFNTLDLCYKYAGYVTFQVKATPVGTPPPLPASLELSKRVRKAGDSVYAQGVTIKAGDQADYQITVRNRDNLTTASNVIVRDIFPAGVLVRGSVILTRPDASTVVVPTDQLFGAGYSIGDLKAGQTAIITVPVQTAATQGGACLTNTAIAMSQTASPSEVRATAEICFSATPTPKPSPTPTPVVPTPTPTPVPVVPTLPRTGPEAALLIPVLLGGAATVIAKVDGRRRALKSALRRSGK